MRSPVPPLSLQDLAHRRPRGRFHQQPRKVRYCQCCSWAMYCVDLDVGGTMLEARNSLYLFLHHTHPRFLFSRLRHQYFQSFLPRTRSSEDVTYPFPIFASSPALPTVSSISILDRVETKDIDERWTPPPSSSHPPFIRAEPLEF